MAALAPYADLRLLDNVGHLTTLETPDVCSDTILNLIAALARWLVFTKRNIKSIGSDA